MTAEEADRVFDRAEAISTEAALASGGDIRQAIVSLVGSFDIADYLIEEVGSEMLALRQAAYRQAEKEFALQ